MAKSRVAHSSVANDDEAWDKLLPIERTGQEWSPDHLILKALRSSIVRPGPVAAIRSGQMSEFVSRDELKLHQDLLEQKAETRAANLQGRMDTLEQRLDGRLDLLGIKLDTLAGQVSKLATGQVEIRQEIRQDNRMTRHTLIGTGIALFLGIAGVLYTAQSTTIAALGNQLSALQAGLSIVSSPAPPRR